MHSPLAGIARFGAAFNISQKRDNVKNMLRGPLCVLSAAMKKYVGLSNKLYSESFDRRKPKERAHRDIVGSVEVYSELLGEIVKREETVSAVESLLILADGCVRPYHYATAGHDFHINLHALAGILHLFIRLWYVFLRFFGRWEHLQAPHDPEQALRASRISAFLQPVPQFYHP